MMTPDCREHEASYGICARYLVCMCGDRQHRRLNEGEKKKKIEREANKETLERLKNKCNDQYQLPFVGPKYPLSGRPL